MKQDRILDMEKMKKEGANAHKNILYPKYEYQERIKVKTEIGPKPPVSLYQEVGYDKDPPENPETGQKHYRRFYADELENIKEIFPKQAFHQVNIIRG